MIYMYNYIYNIASLALSLYIRAWRCLSGMDDIIHDVLCCTCSDFQFMFIPLASLVLVG